MREHAVIQVEALRVHSKPGDDSTAIPGTFVRKPERYLILGKHAGTQADWVKIVSGWIAVKNRVTGEVFAKVESVPDAPVPPPAYETDPINWGPIIFWGVLAAFAVGFVISFFI